MDYEHRYTHFPNLFDTVKGQQAQVALQSDWPVSLSQDILILAWAILLQSYTSITEPVFSVDGKSIKVNIPQGSWIEVQVNGDNDPEVYHTSLSLSRVGFQKT